MEVKAFNLMLRHYSRLILSSDHVQVRIILLSYENKKSTYSKLFLKNKHNLLINYHLCRTI